MKIVIAPNALKESLSPSQAAMAIQKGVLAAIPNARTVIQPLADGGDGMLSAFSSIYNLQSVPVRVTNPNGEPIQSTYGIFDDTAVIEMSLISGLALIEPTARNALQATSYGMGEAILHAYHQGIRNFIIGIGGSATTDGGAGMAQALGYLLLNRAGNHIGLGGGCLNEFHKIKLSPHHHNLQQCTFSIACDVSNPLTGDTGAAKVFAPQKGASPRQVEILDQNLAHFADIIEPASKKQGRNVAGSGAAGGIGFLFHTLLNADLLSGVDLILNSLQFDSACQDASLIFTAEGCLDEQSAMGKVPGAVSEIGKKMGIPVIAIAGSLKPGWQTLLSMGLTAAFSMAPGPVSLKNSMENAADYLKEISSSICRTFLATKKF